jgi:hypothetical protein
MQELLQVHTERRARLPGQTDGAAQRRHRYGRSPLVQGGVRGRAAEDTCTANDDSMEAPPVILETTTVVVPLLLLLLAA